MFVVSQQRAFEVSDGIADELAPDVYADKVSCRRIESVYAWTASSVGSYLAHVFKKAVLEKFSDQFCDGRDACSEFLAEVCKAIVAVIDTETEDLLLHDRVLAVDIA